MNRNLAVSVVLGVAMAATSALTGALTPQARAPLVHELFKLEQMIPSRFDGWTIDPNVAPLTPDPEQKGMLEKIYDQTLSRTYIDPQGQRVMLSIAYGGDQSKSLQLHLPEVCYVAQGFVMLHAADAILSTRYAQVPVKRLVARLHERNEPITYWITIGDKATRSGFEQKLRRLALGLSGEVPDGMLVRVSTVGNDERAGWRVQDRFVADMLAVLVPRDRARLVGAAAEQGAHAAAAEMTFDASRTTQVGATAESGATSGAPQTKGKGSAAAVAAQAAGIAAVAKAADAAARPPARPAGGASAPTERTAASAAPAAPLPAPTAPPRPVTSTTNA